MTKEERNKRKAQLRWERKERIYRAVLAKVYAVMETVKANYLSHDDYLTLYEMYVYDDSGYKALTQYDKGRIGAARDYSQLQLHGVYAHVGKYWLTLEDGQPSLFNNTAPLIEWRLWYDDGIQRSLIPCRAMDATDANGKKLRDYNNVCGGAHVWIADPTKIWSNGYQESAAMKRKKGKLNG